MFNNFWNNNKEEIVVYKDKKNKHRIFDTYPPPHINSTPPNSTIHYLLNKTKTPSFFDEIPMENLENETNKQITNGSNTNKHKAIHLKKNIKLNIVQKALKKTECVFTYNNHWYLMYICLKSYI